MSRVAIETTTVTHIWDSGHKKKLKETKVKETFIETDLFDLVTKMMNRAANDIINKEDPK